MEEMKINLIQGAKPIKKNPYKLAHKYKAIIPKEIEGMLVIGIIYIKYKDKSYFRATKKK